MHPYATDSDERRLIPFLLAGLAMVGAWAAGPLLGWVHVQMPWWLQAPSALGLYGTLYEVFDRTVWRWTLFNRIGLVKLPNLNGRWLGRVTTSFDEHASSHPVHVNIRQTWTKLCIELDGKDSRSHSLVAGLVVQDSPVPVLSYQYLNEPQPDATPTMAMHYGTALLRLVTMTSLEGQYYSGRGRGTFGSIGLSKTA